MSVPRVLLAPTHRTGLASCLAASLVEIAGRQRQHVRLHQLGAVAPASAWDRWEGSAFLDPALYPEPTLVDLYERAVRGAQLSLLATGVGLLDRVEPGAWSPVEVAELLDCPVVLVLDCRGWGGSLAAMVSGFAERLSSVTLGGLVLTGVRDADHRAVLRRALSGGPLPVVGCLYEGDGPGWDSPAPGAWSVPVSLKVLDAVHRQLDGPALESVAGQRGFTPGALGPPDRDGDGPLVLVAAGKGFTPWSRDSIEVLRGAGARVQRLDLLNDSGLPEGTAGLVIAGHLWPDMLSELADNVPLMREIRVQVSEGLPALALGGGMLYLLRRLQDPLGRTLEMAGVIPADGEIIDQLEGPLYLQVETLVDTVFLAAGERVTGWVTTDAELADGPIAARSPLSVAAPGWPAPRREGVAGPALLCSLVLMHMASQPAAARRFVAACADYARPAASSR